MWLRRLEHSPGFAPACQLADELTPRPWKFSDIEKKQEQIMITQRDSHAKIVIVDINCAFLRSRFCVPKH